MKDQKDFDVIIVGGSYSGLAAAMALGRALQKVLIIDSGKPCNRQTPQAHNFLTQDGKTPNEIALRGREELRRYNTVNFFNGRAVNGVKTNDGFAIYAATGELFTTRKLVMATGINDIMPDVPGFSECWGRTVLHCPYCHGYEVKNRPTGILGNGDYGFEFSVLISNWTNDLTLFTNGISTLTREQEASIRKHGVKIVEKEIENLEHTTGQLRRINFKDGTSWPMEIMYSRTPFEQQCSIAEALGCVITEDGYIKVDAMQSTSMAGIFACGDNTTRMRTISNAVATGTTAGIMVNRELVFEKFV